MPRIEKTPNLARIALVGIALVAIGMTGNRTVRASSPEAPAWMHALTSVTLPEHDEKTEAVLLYSEESLTVQPNSKIKRLTRKAYKILRPGGRSYGTAWGVSNSEQKVVSIHGWCIPAQGKDYEVKDKDAIETSVPDVKDGFLATDVRVKILKIPEPEPGNIVGYEIEDEENLFNLQDSWEFQREIPVRESRYTLQLSAGWEYKSAWANSPEIKPTVGANNQWLWSVSNVPAIRYEERMPSWRGLAGQMVVSLLPPGGNKKGYESWSEVSKWSYTLTEGRAEASPEIKQKVAELTVGKNTVLAKIQALANFLQRDVRYVGIELGIGGWQPHAAKDVYSKRYGDCKDKAMLLSVLLKEVGVDSILIVVNTYRGAITSQSPAQRQFNHMILGIRLPADLQDPLLEAVYTDATLGRILIFDPTDEFTPLGQLRGALQGNYALFVMPDGGKLVVMPQLPASQSGIRRSGQFTLNAKGTISGDVMDVRYGDAAMHQRYVHREVTKKEDQVRPIETLLSHSMGTYQITKATIGNLDVRDQPFQYTYSFVVPSYAKTAGELMLMRVCLLGEKSTDVLEKKEPRKYPYEFEGPHRDADKFDITIPDGYVVDELPSPTDVDYSFGSYHSKTVVKGNVLTYTRSYEIKEVTVPLSQMDDLKKFFRMIGSDERGTAVLKPADGKTADAGFIAH